MASANSLASMPIECNASARMPGSTPMPSARTNSTANRRSGIARQNVMIARAAACTTGCGVVLRAAKNASGIETTAASTVPRTAINRVSTASTPIRPGSSRRGGSMRSSRRTTSPKPSMNADGKKSIDHADTMVAASVTTVR